MSAILDLEGVSSGYGEAMVLNEVSLTLDKGEIFALLGKNGMGKSTLLQTVMGFLPLRTGRIRLGGEDISGFPPHRIARKSVAYTPQEQALFQDLSVADNLRLGRREAHGFEEGIARLGQFFPFIPERLRQRAGTLSGGEQKMLLIARALLAEAKLLLIDEISEGLQPSVVERLATVLRAEREERGLSILLIEQNVRFALDIADRYAVLKRGEIADRGRIHDPDLESRITAHLSV
ncbi:MAG TPA: ATP-binding cassette domain-containing protein [Stellaceae bacterium]|nr:ATP-binding cassette domain-containing protein [Stellaceae bacterium]